MPLSSASFPGLVRRVNRLTEIVVIVQFAVLVAVVVAAVFARYVLNNSIVWAEEDGGGSASHASKIARIHP